MCLVVFGLIDLENLFCGAYPTMPSEANKARLNWAQIYALRTLHEATLESLLGAQNYATLQPLSERNQLLRERYLFSVCSHSYHPRLMSYFAL